MSGHASAEMISAAMFFGLGLAISVPEKEVTCKIGESAGYSLGLRHIHAFQMMSNRKITSTVAVKM